MMKVKYATILIILSSCISLYAKQDLCGRFYTENLPDEISQVRSIINKIITDAYPELKTNIIKIMAIEDSKLLSLFSKNRLSFISFFTFKHLLPFSDDGYLIGYSRQKIFQSQELPPEFAVESVLAHELAHTLRWKQLGGIRSLGFALFTALGKKSLTAKYERRIDIEAIYRSVKYDRDYANGLARYRQWNLEQTDPDKRDYLKSVYYFKEQIFLIEEIFQKILNPSILDDFYRALKKEAPQSLAQISKLASRYLDPNSL